LQETAEREHFCGCFLDEEEYSVEEETPEVVLKSVTETSYTAENENGVTVEETVIDVDREKDQSGTFDEEDSIIISRRQSHKRKRILDDEEDFE
jgi:hypothetical protein